MTESLAGAVAAQVPQQLLQCVQRAVQCQSRLRRWSWPQQDSGPHLQDSGDARPAVDAAILMPFFASTANPNCHPEVAHTDGNESMRMLLTRRARHLRRHAGQMSFPGGVAEPGDTSLLATAVRETTEETGIHADFIQPVGKLGDLLTISGYRLHVFVGWLRPGFALQPDPNEVEAVYAAAVDTALNARNHHWRSRSTPAGTIQMPEMTLEQQRVWGITAVIIWHLSCLWHGHSGRLPDRHQQARV
ncbi:MAG: CoA pyrophosphatase [Gammaproteobacteria bacterium]|nr:CoA pyrophosphatase [Gammaproteobacteria bacterium]